jgi:hypothetical protein
MKIRLAKVENTRDRSSGDAGSGCRFSRRSSTRGIRTAHGNGMAMRPYGLLSHNLLAIQ